VKTNWRLPCKQIPDGANLQIIGTKCSSPFLNHTSLIEYQIDEVVNEFLGAPQVFEAAAIVEYFGAHYYDLVFAAGNILCAAGARGIIRSGLKLYIPRITHLWH
jgi:hypothetical protein